MSYKKLKIWQIANELVVKIHRMTLHELPAFEMYEESSQISRSSKSVKSLIVEGYGRKSYKQDFLKFLVQAVASNDETIDHRENLHNTDSLTNQTLYSELHKQLEILGRKLNNFISAVQEKHNLAFEPESIYHLRNDDILTP